MDALAKPGVLAVLLSMSLAAAETTAGVFGGKADRTARVDGAGVMRWEDDGSEVALLGVNYYVPFNWDYRQINRMCLSHAEVISHDVSHFRRLGLDLLRVHCHESDISRKDGSLRENDHLLLLDHLIAECASNGIYTVLTPMAAWGGDWFSGAEEGFSYNVGVERLFSETNRWPAQATYLEAFGRHVNRYTGRSYAEDPSVLCFELVNEPKYPKGTTGRQIADYANMLLGALRRSGTRKPVFYNATWQSSKKGHDLAILSLPYLETDGVSGVCYCTGLLNKKAHEGVMLSRVKRSSLADIPLPSRFSRLVYEFDAADVPGAYMYPAMAALFRSEGVQVAAQFQYDPYPTAAENLSYQTHYLSLIYTPAKALSLAIAADAFRRLPRGIGFLPSAGEMNFPPYRIDAAGNLSELVTEEDFVYTASTDAVPPDPGALRRVWGCGMSSVMASSGNGICFLDRVSKGVWRMQLYPSVRVVADPYTGAKGVKTALLHDNVRLRISLPDVGAGYRVVPVSGHRKVVTAEGTDVTLAPGDYVVLNAAMRNRKMFEAALQFPVPEYFCPVLGENLEAK